MKKLYHIILIILLSSLVFADAIEIVKDANGNIISGDGKFREYNSLNQLVRIRDSTNVTILEEYVHDPVAERILMKRVYNSSNQVAESVYYVDENFVRVVNATGTYDFTYVKHEGQLVAQLNPDGSKFYVHADHEGSTSVVTNSSGGMVENTSYSPYGEILTGGSVSRFDSEGKEFDSVVGDYDFNFRKMNPSWGLFLQPDTIIKNLYDPQTLNHYSFERDNPYRNFDEDGHVAKATIDEKEKTITITATVYIHGKGASERKAQKMEKEINKRMSKDTVKIGGTKWTVQTKVKVMYVQTRPTQLGAYENSVEMKGFFGGLFHRSSVTDRREGSWSSFSLSQGQQGGSLYAHETGHLFGLKDRYSDVEGKFGVYSKANEGYENSLMGGGSGTPTDNDFQNMLGKSTAEHLTGISEDAQGRPYTDAVDGETEHLLYYED